MISTRLLVQIGESRPFEVLCEGDWTPREHEQHIRELIEREFEVEEIPDPPDLEPVCLLNPKAC
jgi:hypothetical protein